MNNNHGNDGTKNDIDLVHQIKNVNELIKKVNEFRDKDELDLSSDEDLSIALMNLISIEEHLYFSGMKTGKKMYFDLLNSIREMRKRLLKEIVKNPEGEKWCISKHLLAASMRLIEVGNKHMTKGKNESAYEKFQDAFLLYSMFWGLNLGLIKSAEIVKGTEINAFKNAMREDKVLSWKGKLNDIVKKIIDCCKE